MYHLIIIVIAMFLLGTIMKGLARALAVELAPMRVNCVMPGTVKTELMGNIPEAARSNI